MAASCCSRPLPLPHRLPPTLLSQLAVLVPLVASAHTEGVETHNRASSEVWVEVSQRLLSTHTGRMLALMAVLLTFLVQVVSWKPRALLLHNFLSHEVGCP